MPQIRDLSDEQIIKEYYHWDDKVRNATAWGAALAAANEFRRDCLMQIQLRGLNINENGK